MKKYNLKAILTISLMLSGISSSLGQYRDANSVQDSKKNGYSDLWGNNGQNWNPAGRLPDVSFCGYNMGYTDIPKYSTKATLGQNGAKANDNKDDATELQNLINTIAVPGVIKIPKGVWNIDKRILLNRSGVVLVGENGAEFKMNKTLRQVDNDKTTSDRYAFTDAFFIIGSRISLQPSKRITKDANHGANTITVENGVNYAVGTWLDITQTDDAPEGLFQYVTGSSEKRAFWNLNNQFNQDPILYLKSLFQLKAKVVKQVGNVITLDRTLPLDIKVKWAPKVAAINLNLSLQNCGIENVKMSMSGSAFAGHFKGNGNNAILVKNAINCWFKNIECVDVDNGIVLEYAFYCTFDAMKLSRKLKSATSDIGHHGFWCNLRSSDNLFSNSEINTTFIHDISVEGVANGNVFSNCSGENINIDHHRGAPYSNVFTQINAGRGTRILGSSGSWYRGPHTGKYTTLWNVKKNNGSFGALPNTSNTGGLGKTSKDWYYLNSVGVKGAKIASIAENRSQYVEFSNGEVLKNPNIFLAQRQKRLNTTTPTPITTQSPYTYSQNIPGIIHVENYDKGGEGVAYHDLNTGNSGNSHRTDNVDVGIFAGRTFVGWTQTGEWLEYQVNVKIAGSYTVKVTYAAGRNGSKIGASFPDESKTLFTGLSLPAQQGLSYEKYISTTKSGITLSSGYHTLRLTVEEKGFNIDSIEFVLNSSTAKVGEDVNPSNDEVTQATLATLVIYPNPSQNGIFTISQKTKWEIYDFQGNKIGEGDGDVIDVSNNKKGTYILKTEIKSIKLVYE